MARPRKEAVEGEELGGNEAGGAAELKIMRIRVECRGISPLLTDPMSDETLEELRTKVSAPKRPDRPAQEVAAEKVYRYDGKIGIPSMNLFASLRDAGKYVKFDARKSISTSDTTLLPELLTIDDYFMPFPDGTAWVTDKRRGVMKSGGKEVAVCVVRPRFDKWEFTVNITIDTSHVSEESFRLLFRYAGSRTGLCSFRPTCGGPFGRFVVTKWERVENKEFSEIED